MKNYLKYKKGNLSITYFKYNDNNYFIDDCGTALYLNLSADPERLILESGGVPATISDDLKRSLTDIIRKAAAAEESAVYISNIKSDYKNVTMRIFTDGDGVAHAFDNRKFADFETKPDQFKLFTWYKDNKALAAFKNGIFLGMILPVRLTDRPEALRRAEEAREEKEAEKARKAAEKAAIKAIFAAAI